MANRPELQAKLESILGSRYVYFQPPESVNLTYPCITYGLSDIDTLHANNKTYRMDYCYDLTVIDYNPDSTIKEKLLEGFSKISFTRHYVSDNLHHDSLRLYY